MTAVDTVRPLTMAELERRDVVSLDDLQGHETATVRVAGKVVGLGKNAAYAAVARGELPSLRFGHRIVVPVAALRRMLEGNGGGR